MILTIVLYLTGLVCIVTTLLPLSRHEAWWIRAWDFPRLQIVAASAGVLAALIASGMIDDTGGLLLALVLLGCVAYQLAVILPLHPALADRGAGTASGRTARGNRTLSLLVVNVLMSNRRADRLLELIQAHAPDLVLAVETDRWWCDQLERLQGYPFRLAHPLDNTYGLLLLSKLELVEPQLRFLLKPEVPSVRTGLRLRIGRADHAATGCIRSRRARARPTAPRRAMPSWCWLPVRLPRRTCRRSSRAI